MIFVIQVILIGSCFSFGTDATFRTNFHVKRFEVCNNTQGQIRMIGNITETDNKYYLNLNITIPMALDENVGLRLKIDTKLDKDFVLHTIREKYACKALNTYAGELWYDVERAAQIIPRQCPIQAGRYYVHHFILDFQKISLQTFPFGRLRFTGGFVDNKNSQGYLLCMVMEVENVIN